MGVILGDLLARYWQQQPLPADALLAVPLHPQRLAERGFNQSTLLARQLELASGLPLLDDSCLVRERETSQQAKLNARERQINVEGAFAWNHPMPPPARILLIDDVMTTGATLSACADVLRAAGCGEVRAIALGRSLARDRDSDSGTAG